MNGAAPLAVRSAGSLLRGQADPSALAARAAELGYGALGLADRDGLYASVAFARACAGHGLRPVLGVELPAGPVGKAAAAARFDGPPVVRVFARDRAGWSALCRLVTARHLDGARPWDEACAEALAGGSLHAVARTVEAAVALLAACRARGFDPSPRAAHVAARVWLGVETPGVDGTKARAAAAAAARLGVPAVATGRVVGLEAGGAGGPDVARTLAALRRNELVARVPVADALDGADPRTAVLEPADAWRARWSDAGPEARRLLAANAAFVDDCRVTLELGVPRFPVAPVPEGVAPFAWLEQRCREGIARRYPSPPAARAARRRLAVELETIERLGFTPYFTLVADIVGFAAAAGIPSVGRGSGAASIVSYVLGITNVDPLRYRLAFERFLHAERRDCPDLDIDLCWIRRDEVIEHVYRTYGSERVAMISTQCALGPRGAFREATRVHGVAPPIVDRLARFVPHDVGDDEPLATLLAGPARRQGIDLAEPALAAALADVGRLVGVLDHLGVHPCGLVIADTALTDYTALEEATKGLVVTQHEMRQIEALGLVKMDLLGNRALTEIGDTIARVSAATGGRVVPKVEPVPDGDPTTAAMLARGDALGVFQLESPGMRNLLAMLDARALDDVIASVSLIRPGPAGAGMKDLYVRRQRGLEPVTFGHPRLEPVLGPQKGVLLYEEDVMAVVAALCDVSLAQGDLFRRALGGTRTEDERTALRRWFAHRARSAGLSALEARAAWTEVARFGAYAFCRAHAAGYGVLAWQAAYLRAHWPAAFASALADHHAGMYGLWVHLADAQRHGVRFLLPCVNRSGEGFTLEGDPVAGPVRVGLSRVRELSRRTIERTLAARAEAGGAFESLADWMGRVRPPIAEAEMLVRAGAFDFTGRARASLLVELGATGALYKGAEEEGAFRVRTSPLPPPDVPEFAPRARLMHEWNALELGVTAHPLAAFAGGLWPPDRPASSRAADGPPGFDAACTLGERIGRRVRVTGLMAAARRVPTKSGDRMFFLTLDDGTGLSECTLFPDVYARCGPAIAGNGPYVVEGVVESQYGEITVTASSCVPFEAGASHGAGRRQARPASEAAVIANEPRSRYGP
jgi:DNA polymerase-3 subunit alpha